MKKCTKHCSMYQRAVLMFVGAQEGMVDATVSTALTYAQWPTRVRTEEPVTWNMERPNVPAHSVSRFTA